jgi:predicted glycosyltransferase
MSRIHFDITHPAHVHLFRHAIYDLVDSGHSVAVSSREKELTTDLLDAYGIDHTVLSTMGTRTIELVPEWLLRDVRTIRYARRFDPDVVVSRLSPTAVHAAAMVGAGAVAFHDHEGTNRLASALAPFTDRICTPATFDGDFGAPHRRHEGLQELAYLHPERFVPDRGRLREHGVDPDEPYAVLRFVSMGAHHDIGLSGFPVGAKRRLIEELSAHGDVYVSTEGAVPPELDAEDIPVPPTAIHDLLSEASLFVTDSNTMATEAGLLGTPTVRSGAYAETGEFSNFAALAEAGLVESIPEGDAAVDRAVELMADPDAGSRWERRRAAYVEGKPDLTDYIVETVVEVAEEHRSGPRDRPRPWTKVLPGG